MDILLIKQFVLKVVPFSSSFAVMYSAQSIS